MTQKKTIPKKAPKRVKRSEEHTSELQSQSNLVCRLLLEKKNTRALQMDAILGVERVIAALNALGCDDGIGQLELTHFDNRAADCGLKRLPRREAVNQTGA